MGMRDYKINNLRNVGIIGHSSSGKTSLTEALLFASKSTDRLGKIDYYEYPTEPFTYKRDSIRDQPDSISNNRPQVKG